VPQDSEASEGCCAEGRRRAGSSFAAAASYGSASRPLATS
jgi:hypothetical protein